MTTADLCLNRRVIWHGLPARIIDIQWSQHSAHVRVVVAGGHEHWARPDELTEVTT